MKIPTLSDIQTFTDKHGLEYLACKEQAISHIFEFKILPSFKLKRFKAELLDFSLICGFPTRLLLPYAPGQLGLEITVKSTVLFKECLEPMANAHPLALPLGISGGSFSTLRLDQSLHLLVAGSTGSGKSTFLRTVIETLRLRNTPESLRIAILDPKGIDFSVYNGDAFIYNPRAPYTVINKASDAAIFLQTLLNEMQARFEALKKANAQDIRQLKMPYIVVLIDEFAELISDKSNQESIDSLITRLAQMGRAAGIYLILATQKPLTAIVSSMVKANFPSRISFRLPAHSDYMSILDETPNSCMTEPAGSAWLKSPVFPTLIHVQTSAPIPFTDIVLRPAPKAESVIHDTLAWEFPMTGPWRDFIVGSINYGKIIYGDYGKVSIEQARKNMENPELSGIYIHSQSGKRTGFVVLSLADREEFGHTLPEWKEVMEQGCQVGFLIKLSASTYKMDITLFLEYVKQDLFRISEWDEDSEENFMDSNRRGMGRACYQLYQVEKREGISSDVVEESELRVDPEKFEKARNTDWRDLFKI